MTVAGAAVPDVARRGAIGVDAAPFRRAFKRLLLAVALPGAVLILWELLVRLHVVEGRVMPPPSRIAQTAQELMRGGDLARHVAATLSRVAIGFLIGSSAGTLLGALSGVVPTVRSMIDPTIQALRAIPSIAWVPLFILWFGIFEASKIALIAVGVFFPVYLGVLGAVSSVDRKLVEVGRVFRLSSFALTARILFPAVFPAWVVAVRTGLGLGFMFVVAAEIMGASEGLGYLLVDGQQLGKPDEILVALIAFALVGQACDMLLVMATRPLISWQDVERRPF